MEHRSRLDVAFVLLVCAACDGGESRRELPSPAQGTLLVPSAPPLASESFSHAQTEVQSTQADLESADPPAVNPWRNWLEVSPDAVDWKVLAQRARNGRLFVATSELVPDGLNHKVRLRLSAFSTSLVRVEANTDPTNRPHFDWSREVLSRSTSEDRLDRLPMASDLCAKKVDELALRNVDGDSAAEILLTTCDTSEEWSTDIRQMRVFDGQTGKLEGTFLREQIQEAEDGPSLVREREYQTVGFRVEEGLFLVEMKANREDARTCIWNQENDCFPCGFESTTACSVAAEDGELVAHEPLDGASLESRSTN